MWRLGETGGGHEARTRYGGLVEDMPRAEAGVHRPPDVELVQRRIGVAARWLYECPCCSRPCRYLYETSGGWRCRPCGRLRYRSKGDWDSRKLMVANRLRCELGGKPGLASALPPRPKTMKAAKRYDWRVRRIAALERHGLREVGRIIKSAERLLRDYARDRSRSAAG